MFGDGNVSSSAYRLVAEMFCTRSIVRNLAHRLKHDLLFGNRNLWNSNHCSVSEVFGTGIHVR